MSFDSDRLAGGPLDEPRADAKVLQGRGSAEDEFLPAPWLFGRRADDGTRDLAENDMRAMLRDLRVPPQLRRVSTRSIEPRPTAR